MICFDKAYSTCRSLTLEKPILEHKKEDAFDTLLFLSEGQCRTGEGGLRAKGYFKTSSELKPLVTIITVVYNGDEYLEETILSVINQTYDNVEYIIIDGGSTDGTLEIIKQYENGIDYWVSEKDSGIYDAMNKGLTLSSGKIIGIINADDCYELDAIEQSVKALSESGVEYSVGNIRTVPSKMIVKPVFPLIEKKVYQEMMYPHISAFIKSNVYKMVGLFDTRYKITADFDMALKIHLNDFSSVYINSVIASLREGGVSGSTRSILERFYIVLNWGKNPILAYLAIIEQLFKYYTVQWIPNRLLARMLKFRKSRFQFEK